MIPLTAFLALTQQCAPAVAPATMAAIVRVESGFNPYSIGVVHGRLERQPANLNEAVATARALEAARWDYSAGLAQVNRANWIRFGLTPEIVFDPCRNLAAGAAILQGCFERARHEYAGAQDALRAGLSCYASGDFSTGFRTGYVQRVVAEAALPDPVVPATAADVPPIRVIPSSPQGARSGPSRIPDGTPSTTGRRRNRQTGLPGDMAQESAVVF
ncbi:type IV secretion system protein VirB1 [Paraburkholderia sp. RAU6.4a]|uniref:lytic transglycosylase domain-containing protein n=1 Tax=unclassified Paraburkholderia TaxID=2615204 RepID=UPI001609316C|nr:MULTISPECIES: lytic transglycosylase domain-containing protein [unclassified Paraburkholderia]MBB5406438.1 type IV secretion system protein VirB1 [Paraburkholderia sp. HC6.4b]MBB5448836.1 type IV secretion system protein VirB1 [Paraburkholderia sp. Kb1A]